MKHFQKLVLSVSIMVSGLLFALPALAATTYSTNGTFYYSSQSTKVIYSSNSGYYSTRYTPKPTVKPSPVATPQPTIAPTPKPTVIPTPKPTFAPPPASTTNLAAEESKMVNLVNQARLSQGIRPLTVNGGLTSLARLKSQDMVNKNYFSHTSPTYGSPFEMMRQAGISYRTAGENLAGSATTESAHQSLMNSPGHKANILNTNFNQIGVGIASGSIYGKIFTQMFIGI